MTFVAPHADGTPQPVLIRNAGVITMDPDIGDLARADIHVEHGVISAIGRDLEAGAASIIEAANMIAIPGFVDGHRHMWESIVRSALPTDDLEGYFHKVNGRIAPVYDPEDAYIGTLASGLGALDAGITTVLDWAHVQNTPDHSSACIAALRESGLRAVFAYGPGAKASSAWPDDLIRLKREEFGRENDRLGLALAGPSPEHAPDQIVKPLFDIAREAGVIISLHCGLEGRGTRGQIERYGREGMLGPDVNLVHCNTLSPAEWTLIAETGTSACITPAVEMQMGHGVPPIQAAMDARVDPALGVDVETSVPGDMFTQMRAAYWLQRMNAFTRHRSGDRSVRMLEPRDVFGFATMAGAVSMGLGERIGRLAPGRYADIVLLRADGINVAPINDMLAAVVLGMDARNVDTVMVGGRVVKRHGRLVGVDHDRLTAELYAARDRIFWESSVELKSRLHRCACLNSD